MLRYEDLEDMSQENDFYFLPKICLFFLEFEFCPQQLQNSIETSRVIKRFMIFEFELLQFLTIIRKQQMSGRDREVPRTDRVGQDRLESNRLGGQSQAVRPATDRELHYQSPTKYDIDYYQRKVNRLENEVSNLQEDLSLHKYRLQKAEDFEAKYELLFAQHQNTNQELDNTKESLIQRTRQASQLRIRLDQTELRNRNLETELQNTKNTTEQVRKRNNEDQSKASSQQAEKRASIQQQYLRQIDNLKSEAKAKEDKLKKQLQEAQYLISSKENVQSSLRFKLDKIKNQKNDEIVRLKQALTAIKQELSATSLKNDEKSINSRTQLIAETQARVLHLRELASDIESTLLQEIQNLNETVAKKDAEITFLLQCDKQQIQQNEKTQNDLKAHIRKLQDRIFIIQRQNEIELFNTVDRLKTQYDENISELNRNFDQIREGHKDQVQDLNQKIAALQKQLHLTIKEAKAWEDQHKQLSLDKQLSVKMLSQKIIGLEKLKDEDLRNYTTSMRQIEDDAKSKLEDLHTAVLNKNTEFEILNAQLRLKNEEINYLIQEINKLRNENREKMRKLETTNSLEQNALNQLINSYKKDILELKRRNHELESEISDINAQAKMKHDLNRQQLNAAQEANALLTSRNDFLTEWCKELENDLKKERISNVDILHDHTVSKRETVQIREQVKIQLEVIKDREVEQIRNVFKLEKGRLESDLIKKQQQLNALKAENNRLLVQYKNLERKLGKPSKLDKGEEENGKCKATLEAQILLTENIFRAINRL